MDFHNPDTQEPFLFTGWDAGHGLPCVIFPPPTTYGIAADTWFE